VYSSFQGSIARIHGQSSFYAFRMS